MLREVDNDEIVKKISEEVEELGITQRRSGRRLFGEDMRAYELER